MEHDGNGACAAPSARVVELDALRGLAALAVVAFHYTTFYGREVGHVQPLAFGFPAGNYGVQLFFLISGFVIFMTLERTRTAMDFVVSRFSRLFPAYWAAIAITAAVVYTIGMPQQRIPLSSLLLNLFMVQDFFGIRDLDGSYWTLQVELFFYAQMLFWFVVGKLRHILWIIAGWLLMAIANGEAELHHVHFSYAVRELLILRYIPYFAMGILFYRLHAATGSRAANMAMIVLCLATIALVQAPVFLAAGLVCCAIFALFVGGRLRWMDSKPFVVLGAVSYSLYLLHQAIGFAAIHWLERALGHSLPAIAIAVVGVSVLAALLTYGLERPAMHAIRRAWHRRGVSASAVTQGGH